MTKDYGMVNTLEDLSAHMQEIFESGLPFGFDVELGYYGPDREGGALDHLTNILVGFSYAKNVDWARYVPLQHDEGENLTDFLEVAIILWNAFKCGMMVGHNMPTELTAMARFFRTWLTDHPIFGAEVRASDGYFPYRSDTMGEAYILREYQFNPDGKKFYYGLKALIELKFGHKMIHYEDLFGSFINKKEEKCSRFNILLLTDRVVIYGCEDSAWALAAHLDQWPRVMERFPVVGQIDTGNEGIVQVVCDMQDCGIVFDWDFLKQKDYEAQEFAAKLAIEIQSDIRKAVEGVRAEVEAEAATMSDFDEAIQKEVERLKQVELAADADAKEVKKVEKKLFKTVYEDMGKSGDGRARLRYIEEFLSGSKPLNLGSPLQLKNIFFIMLNMQTKVFSDREKTKPSTDDDSLTYLMSKYPEFAFLRKISDYRKITKLSQTYTGGLQKKYGNTPTGRVHSSLNAFLVETARFSSSGPNQQNFPSSYIKEKDENGKETGKMLSYNLKLSDGSSFKMNFKDSIVCPEDFYILGFDLAQAELRVIAGESGEKSWFDAFANGVDIHTKNTCLILKIPESEVTKETRQIGKTFGLSVCYGKSAYGLADELGRSLGETEDLLDKFFGAVPFIAAWIKNQKIFGYENGGVFTKFGRWIPLPGLQDHRKWIRESAERACFNYPAQSAGTGDYLRIGMIRARKMIRANGWKDKVKLFMNIHDAIELYVHNSINPADAIALLEKAFIFPVEGWPPMKADWHFGQRLGSVKDLIVLEDGSVKVDEEEQIFIPTQAVAPIQETIVEAVEVQEGIEGPVSEGSTVVVSMDRMPSPAQLMKLRNLLLANPGNNVVVLETPQGDKTLKTKTSLSPKESNLFTQALAACRVVYKVEEDTVSSLIDSMDW